MATQITQREEDGSIPTANPTGLSPGNVDVVFASAQLGDGAFGTTTGDFDFYRVDANAGSFITVRAIGAVFGLDTEVRLYDSAGTLVAFNDNFDGTDSFVQFPVSASGPYFVAISEHKTGSPNPTDPFVAGTGTGGPDAQPPLTYRVFINDDSIAENSTAGDDVINGNGQNNLLIGGAGADIINGGAGNDVIEGGTGNDILSGGSNSDLFIWRNGDGTDVVDGGAGTDRQDIFLASGVTGDNFSISAGGAGDAVFTRSNLGVFSIDTTSVERMDVFALGGNDVAIIGSLAGTSLTDVRLFMGGGNDTVDAAGTAVSLTIQGGPGNDALTGGMGDDTYLYSPGDGADTITNFTAGPNSAFDRIDLTAFSNIHSSGDVLMRATQVGANTVIDLGGGDTITLQNVAKGSLVPNDFVVSFETINAGFHGDFGGDRHADVLFRQADGSVMLRQMNGATIVSSTNIGQVGNEWHIDSVADFNGDAKADVLWRADDGTVAMWQMNGAQIAVNSTIGNVGNEWHINGTADFNGDGKNDILWRADDGTVAMWQMNGAQIAVNSLIGKVGHEWHVQGLGDFGGDGKADVLWRADDGTVALWQMNGTQIIGNNIVGNVGNEWHVVGTGDFNGDGKNDILWRANDGTIAMWQMNAATIQSNQTLGLVGNEWRVEGTGDFNGDGKTDILWQEADGTESLWTMNGSQIASQQLVAAIPSDSVIGVHHFDLL